MGTKRDVDEYGFSLVLSMWRFGGYVTFSPNDCLDSLIDRPEVPNSQRTLYASVYIQHVRVLHAFSTERMSTVFPLAMQIHENSISAQFWSPAYRYSRR
jgi:hypothetical protein